MHPMIYAILTAYYVALAAVAITKRIRRRRAEDDAKRRAAVTRYWRGCY